MIWLLLALAGASAAYQLLALAAALRHRFSREPEPQAPPPVSVLKPVYGLDPRLDDAIRSHAAQDYPEFEILFGVHDRADPGVPATQRLASAFPRLSIRLVAGARRCPNGKVGVLAELAAAARHPVLVISDSDIHVSPGYLRRVVAPLADPRNGAVTCLYRAVAEDWPSRFEALGIATDFAASVLVARLLGVSGFALGSTIALRAADLPRIGGFEAIGDYLADDYQLGGRIHGLGLRVVLSSQVVETRLASGGWRAAWCHQVRWARTIRVSRGSGYLGLPLANASLWALGLAAGGRWGLAAALLALRIAAGAFTGAVVLRAPDALRLFPLIPLRDLYALAVWAAGLFGTTVVWRDQKLRLSRDGRILAVTPASAGAPPRG